MESNFIILVSMLLGIVIGFLLCAYIDAIWNTVSGYPAVYNPVTIQIQQIYDRLVYQYGIHMPAQYTDLLSATEFGNCVDQQAQDVRASSSIPPPTALQVKELCIDQVSHLQSIGDSVTTGMNAFKEAYSNLD